MRGAGDTLEWGSGGGGSLAIGTVVDGGTARSVLFLDDMGALSEKNNTPSGSLTYTTACVLKATTFGEEGSIFAKNLLANQPALTLAAADDVRVNIVVQNDMLTSWFLILPDTVGQQSQALTVSAATVESVTLGWSNTRWILKTPFNNNEVLSAGDKVLADTGPGGFTLKLPASPSTGDSVRIGDASGTFSAPGKQLTLDGNGNAIGSGSPIQITKSKANVEFVFNGSAWSILGEYADAFIPS
jgi:hypothetical protein